MHKGFCKKSREIVLALEVLFVVSKDIASHGVVLDEIISNGIELIPAHEKTKAPLVKEWKDANRLSVQQILDICFNRDQYGFAMVLGKRSGNIICVDIDTKYKLGIDGKIFTDLKEMYPEIWERLRIEKTQSGGYHILYRVKDPPSSCKLASREATEEELSEKPRTKEYSFLEIKGEGGLSQCYPSVGYTLVKESADGLYFVDELTKQEHESIIAICSSYNEVIKIEKPHIKPTISEQYSQNPFEHFNGSEEGALLLEKQGWTEVKRHSEKVYYCRPDAKNKKDIHAAFNLSKRIYTIWTTSTGIDTKSYSPSNLIAELEYGGDKKGLYDYLVAKGYGVLKPSVEKKIIERRAKNGTPLPANISEDAKKEFEEKVKEIKETYPYGIFWDINENGVLTISQMDIDSIVEKIGFRSYRGNLVLIEDWKLKHVTDAYLSNCLLLYIKDDKEAYNAYSKHIDKYGKLTAKRVHLNLILEDEFVLKSSKTESFKFYKNLYLSITKDGIEELKYEDIIDRYVVEKDIINRDFKLVSSQDIKKSLYYKFLDFAVEIENKENQKINKQILDIIGYLTHDYIDDTMSSIIICTEKCEDVNKGGGSGKNLFFNLLNHVTSVHVVDGRQVSLDERLLQSFNGERIFVISDVKKDFDVSFFKNFSSGAASVKKLYENISIIERSMMPKPVILTNFSYKMSAGLERRVVDLEFTDYFSKIEGGVAKKFGKLFPEYGRDSKGGWDDFEFNCFDTLVATSIQSFLIKGELRNVNLSENGWRKQFILSYSHLLEFIEINIGNWVENKNGLMPEEFSSLYTSYCQNNGVKTVYQYSGIRINEALSDYCKRYNIGFEHNKMISDNGDKKRVRMFVAKENSKLRPNEAKENNPF